MSRQGKVFAKPEALMDYELAIEQDRLKPHRYLAKRWGWKTKSGKWDKSGVTRYLKDLNQDEPEVNQEEPETGVPDTLGGAFEPEVNQDEPEVNQYRIELDKDKDLITNTGIILQDSARARVRDYADLLDQGSFAAPLRGAASCRDFIDSFIDHYAFKTKPWTGADGEPLSDWRKAFRVWIKREIEYQAERDWTGNMASGVRADGGVSGRPKGGTLRRIQGGGPADQRPKRDGELSIQEYLIKAGYSEGNLNHSERSRDRDEGESPRQIGESGYD